MDFPKTQPQTSRPTQFKPCLSHCHSASYKHSKYQTFRSSQPNWPNIFYLKHNSKIPSPIFLGKFRPTGVLSSQNHPNRLGGGGNILHLYQLLCDMRSLSTWTTLTSAEGIQIPWTKNGWIKHVSSFPNIIQKKCLTSSNMCNEYCSIKNQCSRAWLYIM